MSWLLALAGSNSKDVIYVSLPLYHSVGFLGFAAAIDKGKINILHKLISPTSSFKYIRLLVAVCRFHSCFEE